MGRLSNPQVLADWGRALKLHAAQATTPMARTVPRRRNGWVARLVLAELAAAGAPLWPAEVRTRIERRTGTSVRASSVKDSLRRGALRGTVIRTEQGYRLA